MLALPGAAAAALGEASWMPQWGKESFVMRVCLHNIQEASQWSRFPMRKIRFSSVLSWKAAWKVLVPVPGVPLFLRVGASGEFQPLLSSLGVSLVSFCFIIKSAQSLLDIEQRFSIEPWNQRLDWIGKELQDQFIPAPAMGKDTSHYPRLLL